MSGREVERAEVFMYLWSSFIRESSWESKVGESLGGKENYWDSKAVTRSRDVRIDGKRTLHDVVLILMCRSWTWTALEGSEVKVEPSEMGYRKST